MEDELAHKLHLTTDGSVWAAEFMKLFEGYTIGEEGVTEGTMIGWFANAIETGREHG